MIQVHVAGTSETPQSIILQPFLNLLELFAIVFPNNNFMMIYLTQNSPNSPTPRTTMPLMTTAQAIAKVTQLLQCFQCCCFWKT